MKSNAEVVIIGGGVRQSRRDPRELPLAMYGVESAR